MIKKEILTAIGVALLGVIISFFVVNLINSEIKDFPIKTVEGTNVNANLSDPDPEVFNARAINPTVEVHVGEEQTNNNNGTAGDGSTTGEGM